MTPAPAIQVELSASELTALARCVDTIGTSEFAERICGFCARVGKADKVFLSAFFESEKPAPIYSNHTTMKEKKAIEIYLDLSYILDPFYIRFKEKRGDEVINIKDLAPDGFKKSEYYQKFYKAMGLDDECGIMVHISDTAALFFSFGVSGKGRHMESSRLAALLPLLNSLVRRHWTTLTPERPGGSGRLASQLESAFQQFGTSQLSPRESEIARMILQGHSSKSIAKVLNISPETVKIHRRRLYSKIGISSHGELFSVFIASLSIMPLNYDDDPLNLLHAESARA
jgi:DNA-binding CsgD family transcriptional regulator